MLHGLQELERSLAKYRIPFVLVTGNPETEIPRFVLDHDTHTLITDFSPLRVKRIWQDAIAEKINVPFSEVDSHNIIPCRMTSDKQEYAAYTIRPRIQRLLPEFLTEFPRLQKQSVSGTSYQSPDWKRVFKSLQVDTDVAPVRDIFPGEKAAQKTLRSFLKGSLQNYAAGRNDPNQDVQSGLSPYLHFGQISAQRVALAVNELEPDDNTEAFLEELVVRRELSDNYCHYNRNYDSSEGFPDWARKTLDDHRTDPRPALYSRRELEMAKTADDLWNAAQTEMVVTGKMHGYLRMYWAKKILEWSTSPEEALTTAIYLNDKYELDGRDPNGYAGIAWSIGGVHDRAWPEREVFGKVRYMSYNGSARKFDVPSYVQRIEKLRKVAVA
jgi:deoxyribodipyrimidine photo-lyase